MSTSWVDTAIKLKKAGVSWANISEELYKVTGERHATEKIRGQLRRKMPRDNPPEPEDLHNEVYRLITRGQTSLAALSERLDRSASTVMGLIEDLKEQGYRIDENESGYYLQKDPVEENMVHQEDVKGDTFRFGLTSDTHLCSKYQQLSYLNHFYDLCCKQGIETVFHTGDILDGEGIYKGHQYEIFMNGSDDQVEYTINHYPERPGITTKFITGNHDLCYYKKQGQDVGRQIEQKRSDMVYLGQLAAYVDIAPGVNIYLLHPDGGPSYATSYRAQKIAAGFTGGEKPSIMALGHWHKNLYLFERNIHIFCTMCFQAQTPYLKRKGLSPEVGGYLVEMKIADGEVAEVTSTLVPFYRTLEKDY